MNADETLAALDAADAKRIDVTFPDRGEIELLKPVRVIVAGRILTAPRGFRCDGASIPRPLWSVFGHPFTSNSLRAAIIHDYCCRTNKAAVCANRTMSSSEAHHIFALLLAVDGVAPFRRWCMAAAVRWFGPRWTYGPGKQ